MKILKIILFLFICLSLTSCNDSDDKNDEAVDISSDCGNFKVINGTECSRKDIPVVLLEFSAPNSRGVCTGTVIGNNHILTAAHCFPGTTGVTIIHDNGSANGETFFINPNYNGTSESDTAIIVAADIATNLKINAASINGSSSVSKGDLLSFIGYGLDENDDIAISLPNANPRVTDIKVIDNLNTEFHTRFEETNSNPCGGDSGGAAFKDGLIVGVESAGIGEVNCREGGFNILSAINNSSNLEFLKTFVPDIDIR